MQKILFTLTLITAGLMFGYLGQIYLYKKYSQQKAQQILPRLRKLLQHISMVGIMPIAFVGVIWIISFENLKIVTLPLLGSALLLTGGGLGLLQARMMNKTGGQKSVLFCCGFFSNLGSVGGLISFVFLGEHGFAMLAFYRLFEEILYYSIGFPLAKYFKNDTNSMRIMDRLTDVIKDPFFIAATGSFILGLALNLSGIERPPFYETLNSYFVPVGIFLILLSIGLGMRFSSLRNNLKAGLVMAAIKHLCLPVIGAFAAWMFGFHLIENGLPFKIVLICSSMPIAFNGLIVASVYDLDLDLANTCWLISTLALIPVIPALYLLFNIL